MEGEFNGCLYIYLGGVFIVYYCSLCKLILSLNFEINLYVLR